uniref:Uncharacterized protein n=1 Tax=Helianthus annuus TaxID=4232 RepID=A0A251SSV3_HELAN
MDFDTPPKSSSLNVIPASDHSGLVTMVAVLVDDSRTSWGVVVPSNQSTRQVDWSTLVNRSQGQSTTVNGLVSGQQRSNRSNEVNSGPGNDLNIARFIDFVVFFLVYANRA